MTLNKPIAALLLLAFAGYSNAVIAAEDVIGVVKLRRPFLANYAVKGTIDSDGSVNLLAENGTKTTGTISLSGNKFKADLKNETSFGKFFFDGKTTDSFVVNGVVKQGIYIGDFNSTDEGQLILCGHRAYKKNEAGCTGNGPVNF